MNKQEPKLLELSKWWKGAHLDHDHSSTKNIVNACLCFGCLLPTVILTKYLYGRANGEKLEFEKLDNWNHLQMIWSKDDASQWDKMCQLCLWSPLLMVNMLFFINIDIMCYLVGVVQLSFWLLDPLWSILPELYGVVWRLHPNAVQSFRGDAVILLTSIWGIRLTHNYFRREEWKFGTREDWRYTKMAMDYGWPLWFFVSFFATAVAQHPMIVGIALPLYSVRFGPKADTPWGLFDTIATLLGLLGILIAFIADNQLRAYMLQNERLKQQGQPTAPILVTGLWRYSRHPNYFGEQLWWWSLALFSVQCGQPWCIIGTLINSIVLFIVTFMTEGKMLTEWTPERANLLREYQRTTSGCIPWFHTRSKLLEPYYISKQNKTE